MSPLPFTRSQPAGEEVLDEGRNNKLERRLPISRGRIDALAYFDGHEISSH
jgi:hypothetical protein